ncbi:unnamed protein product (macronuclear) [Paramecium tetraurelia]|uniref:Peptidase C1A papain C-terminal domain-containing protein n=1 Tax=Paramecium tetraurelia TaxID=5888 RepID=A0CHI8_PARTE|nr:uncharacterized protein GSPATT00038357001 [Paramecium tetraurelia]CAK70255.1 unnamed protein product [Paramecium tetraurelia]|eukprot:XP_001437652.1 hypothetical protein (macronuclear) [Paramecium tetraurelia strain d4-2]
MNQNKTNLYGILVDISGSMKYPYETIEKGSNLDKKILQPNESRLASVLQIIQGALGKHDLKDDHLFLSAFGCYHDVEVIDLVPFLKSIINIVKLIITIRGLQQYSQNCYKDYPKLLYDLVEGNGAKNLSQFYKLQEFRTDISNIKAQLLYNEFKRNKKQLNSFIEKLPKQVKMTSNTYSAQALLLGRKFQSTLNPIISKKQKKIQQQLLNLDNCIPFDYFFGKIQECLQPILDEIQKLNNKNNNKADDLENKLQQILEKVKNQQQQKSIEYLQDKLREIQNIQENIIQVLKQYSFIPNDLINEQINLEKFQIISIEEVVKDIKIEEYQSKYQMKKEDLDFFKSFESICYGCTPLKKSLELTLKTAFLEFKNKFLFIVSDGDSTDGNPVEYATELKNKGFIIFCYYISSSNSASKYIKGEGAKTMFEISSEYSNFEFPLRQIENYTNIKLSQDGKSRLFLQSNNSESFKQFLDYFMKISKDNDKLIEIAGRITIEKQMSSSKGFQPKRQIGGTCYATSIATVYSIMLQKIYKREGDYPGFFRIRDLLIQEYGKHGAITSKVVQETCSYYRLQCRKLKSISKIKQALHQQRPIIARFALCDDQWNANTENQMGFIPFFERNPFGILTTVGPQSNKNIGGHSVVLYSYTEDYYLFINSWGTSWGDRGFFKVQSLDVLGEMEFIEVFWETTDLTESEKKVFKEDAGQKMNKFYQNYLSSIGNIKYTCPKCFQQSFINQYKGNYYDAECPKCNQQFHSESLGSLFVDYLNGKNI